MVGVLPLCQEFLSNVSREPVPLVLMRLIGLCGLASLSSQKAFFDFKSGIFLWIGAMKLKLFGIFFETVILLSLKIFEMHLCVQIIHMCTYRIGACVDV